MTLAEYAQRLAEYEARVLSEGRQRAGPAPYLQEEESMYNEFEERLADDVRGLSEFRPYPEPRAERELLIETSFWIGPGGASTGLRAAVARVAARVWPAALPLLPLGLGQRPATRRGATTHRRPREAAAHALGSLGAWAESSVTPPKALARPEPRTQSGTGAPPRQRLAATAPWAHGPRAERAQIPRLEPRAAVTAGIHYDASNGLLHQLRGSKRCTLWPPSQRHNLYPSDKYNHGAKLSAVDPSAPNLTAVRRVATHRTTPDACQHPAAAHTARASTRPRAVVSRSTRSSPRRGASR
jgi:hypothetical protein